jgi:DNA invertase Pin-like site-specific DNA recombinase
LHLIRSRLTAGLHHKAARGELRQGLPVGFDYDPDDHVVMSPDEAVVEAIATVFRRFTQLGSARQARGWPAAAAPTVADRSGELGPRDLPGSP